MYDVYISMYRDIPVSSRALPMRWHAETLSCELMMLLPKVAGLRLVLLPFALIALCVVSVTWHEAFWLRPNL